MSGELPIIAKVHEVLVWTLPHLAKLPRTDRFLAGLSVEEFTTLVG